MKMVKKPNRNINKEKNILYTGFGDVGTTTLFDCKQGRISKSAILIEALGSVDELNAYIGIIKVYADIEKISLSFGKKKILCSEIVEDVQQVLFVIQAELGGSDIKVSKKNLNDIEKIINLIGDVIPPIKSFTMSGGSLLSAELDFARTLARRAERRIIATSDEGSRNVSKYTLAYMNRLSSLFFCFISLCKLFSIYKRKTSKL